LRTDLALLCACVFSTTALAAEDGALSAERFSVALPLEAHVIGAAAGVRPEVTWRPFAANGVFHLRAAAGMLPGTEYLFLPADLGVRWWWRPAWWAQPFVGLSVEGQGFVIEDGPPAGRIAVASELGWGIAVDEALTWSVSVAPSLAPFGVPGPGLALRTTFSFDVAALTY
jgi:hypothetical protein